MADNMRPILTDKEAQAINNMSPMNQFLGIGTALQETQKWVKTVEDSGGGGGTADHTQLTNRDADGQHPVGAITGLADLLANYLVKVSGNSEFFNENDGGGLVYKDSAGREVAGIALNGNCPQLYIHRYTTPSGTALDSRVLVEVHEDGLYISTVLAGTAWVKIPDTVEVNALIASAVGGLESFSFDGPYTTPEAVSNPDNQHIYLIGAASPYDEYCYINSAWEKIGSTEIDLSPYRTASDQDTIDAGKQATLNRTVQTNLASTDTATDTGGDIAPGVTGTLPVAQGGTGATTALAAQQALTQNFGVQTTTSIQGVLLSIPTSMGSIFTGSLLISVMYGGSYAGQIRIDFSLNKNNSMTSAATLVYNTTAYPITTMYRSYDGSYTYGFFKVAVSSLTVLHAEVIGLVGAAGTTGGTPLKPAFVIPTVTTSQTPPGSGLETYTLKPAFDINAGLLALPVMS
jgi:hypothetical protein